MIDPTGWSNVPLPDPPPEETGGLADPVTPVTVSHPDPVPGHDRDSVSPRLSPARPHETPDQEGVSDSVTGVTGTEESVSALHGLTSGAWLDTQTFPAVEYVVPRLIPEGFTLLVGAPKAGKSWLSLDMALGVACGGRVLDQRVNARPVLHLALEDSHRRLQYRARVLLAARESLPAAWFYMLRMPQGHSVPSVVEAWLDTLDRDGPAPLVIVDTLGKVRPAKRPNEGVYDYDYRIGGAMKRLADDWPGAAVVAVHHDRKAGAADFVDDVSGSNGLAGAADTIVIVRRDRNSAEGTFLVTGRDVTEGAYAASFHGGHWSLAGGGFDTAANAYTQTAAAMGKGETAQRIIGWLTENQPATPKAVTDALGISHDLVRKTLSRLAKDGRLDTAEGGLYFLPDYTPTDHDQENTA